MARKSQNLNSNFKLRPFQDDDYGGLVALRNIIEPDHPKSVDQMRHSDKTHKDKIRQKRWVWEKNGDIAVSALYTQFFEAYHPQKFALFIHVHPDLQGQGYGSASYDHLMQEIKPFDPIKITTEVRENHPRGIRFMEERGFTNTMNEQESRLDLNAYDPSQYQNEVDRVLDQGFRIVTLTELRREDERADYRTWALEREVAPDMPWTDPISIPKFDHYQAYILKHPCFNSDSWFLVLKGNHIAGLNNLWKTPNKKVVTTGFTGVRRKYRRKGLATALKHTCLTWAKVKDLAISLEMSPAEHQFSILGQLSEQVESLTGRIEQLENIRKAGS
jgi:GNAT superfamily N-acetyltransferase